MLLSFLPNPYRLPHASLRPQYFLTAMNNAKYCWRV